MKKTMVVMLCVFASYLSSEAALTINWSGNGGLSLLYDSAGNQITTDGLLIQLVIDANNNTSVGTMISSGQLGIGSETALGGVSVAANASDDLVGTWNAGTWVFATSGHYAPFVSSDVDPHASNRFYFRWFNADTQGAATQAGFIYNSANLWVSPADGSSPAASADIQFAGTDPNATGSQFTAGPNDGWATVAPVPEPTTMALMGLGLAAVAARRKFAKKA